MGGSTFGINLKKNFSTPDTALHPLVSAPVKKMIKKMAKET